MSYNFFFNAGWQTHMPRGRAHRAQIPDSRHTQQDTDEAQVEEGGRGRGRGGGGGGAGVYIYGLQHLVCCAKHLQQALRRTLAMRPMYIYVKQALRRTLAMRPVYIYVADGVYISMLQMLHIVLVYLLYVQHTSIHNVSAYRYMCVRILGGPGALWTRFRV